MTGTRGKDRRDHAEKLWVNHLAGGACARKFCEELLGSKVFDDVKKYYDGHVPLKKKMRSL